MSEMKGVIAIWKEGLSDDRASPIGKLQVTLHYQRC